MNIPRTFSHRLVSELKRQTTSDAIPRCLGQWPAMYQMEKKGGGGGVGWWEGHRIQSILIRITSQFSFSSVDEKFINFMSTARVIINCDWLRNVSRAHMYFRGKNEHTNQYLHSPTPTPPPYTIFSNDLILVSFNMNNIPLECTCIQKMNIPSQKCNN